MKIKNFKFFLAGALAFAMIFTFRECKEYKVKQEQKKGEVKFKIEKIEFDDVFTPVDSIPQIKSEPEISYNNSK